MPDHHVPESPCPDCGKMQDGAWSDDPTALPRPGDVSICLSCFGLSVFGDDMIRRVPTEQDIQDFPLDDISRYQRAIKELNNAKS